MTKESILYNRLSINYFTLRTYTLRTEQYKTTTTYYYVKWFCDYGLSEPLEQEISKEEYEYLLKELNNANT